MNNDNFQSAIIKVIGIGGGGGNAVNKMSFDKSDQVEYWVFNTERQALRHSTCKNTLVLGNEVTKGLGAGGYPDVGEQAAISSYEDIKNVVKDADLVFLACGEGGGTGTGATPVVAKAAKECGCLVVAIVTRPFSHEGSKRNNNANKGIIELKKYVDSLIIVPNDKLILTNNGSLTVLDAFNKADLVLAESVKTITDIILINGVINLDFADVRRTLENKGTVIIGVGEATGKDKAIRAAQNAIKSPLLETSIRGAKKLLINVTIGTDITMEEYTDAISTVKQNCSTTLTEDDTIEGLQVNNNYIDKIKVAVIASEFDRDISIVNNYEPDSDEEKQIPGYLQEFLAQEQSKKIIPLKEENEENKQKEIEELKIEKDDNKEESNENLLSNFFSSDEYDTKEIPLNDKIQIFKEEEDDDSTVVSLENNTTSIEQLKINLDDEEDDDVIVEIPS